MREEIKKLAAILCTTAMLFGLLAVNSTGNAVMADSEDETTDSEGYYECYELTGDKGVSKTVAVGNWEYYIGTSWCYAEARCKVNDDGSFTMNVIKKSSSQYGLQVDHVTQAVTIGVEYTYTITITTDAACTIDYKDDGSNHEILLSMDLEEGDNVLSVTYTPTASKYQFWADLSYVPAGTTITFSEPVLTATDDSGIATLEETSISADISDSTSSGDEAGDSITVGKTKVKKAVKKSKKKVSLKLKKVAVATKYRIQISKKKKFKKKNIILKKNVKKLKVVVKSKKFKKYSKLYVRARAIAVVDGKKYKGKWSKVKKVKKK